jgi:ABC-2 type transport system ATP-binding protein
MEVVLDARSLTKRYKDTVAVDEIDLMVRAGERVALLGPNGAGKTSTLFMILGVLSPDGGTIEVVGERLPRGRARAMTKVGFSAGYMPLADRLRVDEFLRLYGQLYGIRDPGPRIDAGLRRFDIAHLATAQGRELSSGQRTLIGIVKATLTSPRLLVLDEPTASLDPDVALRVRTGLLELCREEGTALLITSHNMVEIERLCDRVVFLQAGHVIADDTPDRVAAQFGRGNLEDVFLHLAGAGRDEAKAGAPETERPL